MACISKRRNRYVIDFYDHNGKRRWKTLPEGTTKKKAQEEMRDIEDQVRKRIFLPDQKVPLFKTVAQDWLKHKKANIRESTWDMYRAHLDHHFDSLNDIKINRIGTVKAEKFITEKQESGMSLALLRKVIVTFNQVMQYAVRHRYIDYNPVRDAERPRGKGEEEDKPTRILSPVEINSLLDATENREYQTLFRLAIFSGARQGELFGLKWTDVDWFNNQIQIQRTFNKGKWYRPKSKHSNRKIDLGPAMIKELKKWKLACPKSDLDLVFPNGAGMPINHANMLSRFFFPALEKAGIQRIRFHDMRHTFASLLIEQGENIKYIQSQLGHASPMVTLTIYAHLMNPTNQKAACTLENTIFSTTGSKTVAQKEKGVTP